MPSLAQLDEAVREYSREFPDDVITVVVDATFGHRIDPSERAEFDTAVANNELVSPPAGAIGRGDAFLLRVADKVGATVLSNDSFQEFHGEHEWLFNNGRLIGGKPVPGVGWVFTARTPVRGPKSREAVRAGKRAAKKVKEGEEQQKVQQAIAVATEEAVEPDAPSGRRRRRKRGSAPPAEPVNEPLPFIEFVASHPLGSEVEGEVESFSSHGAFVVVGDLRCYIPLSAMGDPPPRAARDALSKGESRTFVVQALDAPRRGIELALPEFAHVSGEPTPETVEEEIKRSSARKRAAGRGRARKAAREAPAAGQAPDAEAPAASAPAKRSRARKTAQQAPPPEAAPEEPAVAEPAAGEAPAKRSRARKAAPEKAPASKVAAKKVAAKKVAAKKAAAKKAAAKKAAAKKAAATKAGAGAPAAKRAASGKAAAKKSASRATAGAAETGA